jgi:hypothetical protein
MEILFAQDGGANWTFHYNMMLVKAFPVPK